MIPHVKKCLILPHFPLHGMAPTEIVASFCVLRKLCSILVLYVLFLTRLGQEILNLITYSWEELLDIRARSTYQHYDQEYDIPESDPLFGPPPRTMDRIPVQIQRRLRRGRWSGLLVRLHRWAHLSLLPSVYYSPMSSLLTTR